MAEALERDRNGDATLHPKLEFSDLPAVAGRATRAFDDGYLRRESASPTVQGGDMGLYYRDLMETGNSEAVRIAAPVASYERKTAGAITQRISDLKPARRGRPVRRTLSRIGFFQPTFRRFWLGGRFR